MNYPRTILLTALASVTLCCLSTPGTAQYCTVAALRTRRALPKLEYKCEGDEVSHEDALRSPGRIKAIRRYQDRLSGWYSSQWWRSPIAELVACDIRKRSGKLNKEEREVLDQGLYSRQVFGDKDLRVVRVDDPCFKSDYGDSNIFLLDRRASGIVATQLIDDFFSRSDDPLDANFATQNGERIVEVASNSGGLQPSYINYYFGIDKKTGKAKPKMWFKDDDGKPTNQVRSEMLMEEPEAYGLSAGPEPMVVITKGRVVKSFIVYRYKGNLGGTDHPEFEKVVLRWNGKGFS